MTLFDITPLSKLIITQYNVNISSHKFMFYNFHEWSRPSTIKLRLALSMSTTFSAKALACSLRGCRRDSSHRKRAWAYGGEFARASNGFSSVNHLECLKPSLKIIEICFTALYTKIHSRFETTCNRFCFEIRTYLQQRSRLPLTEFLVLLTMACIWFSVLMRISLPLR